MEGVIRIFTAKDVDPARNHFGTITKDEEVFASTKVVCNGQIIAVVIAENQFFAQEAARSVKIEYEDLEPKIITIEDAIKEKSLFHDFTYILNKGDIDQGFQMSEHVISGEVRTGGQEHFYLETMTVIVVPTGEDSEMIIHSTTQNLSEIQATVAHFLGIPQNRIVCKVKRMGGAFGGKESRSCLLVLPAALAANRLKRPIRCMLDRDEDMIMTGTRHPYLGRYKVGFNKEGKIIALEVEMYINGGNSLELSSAVLMKSLFHLDNAYYIPNLKCSANICKTNLPSNTGFRGFGAPQSMFLAENVIRHIASYLKKDVMEVALTNFYKTGDKTHYNQTLNHCTIEKCWNKCLEESNYLQRKREVEEYNRQVKETVASKALGIPDSLIHINETSTDKVPNTSATAASSSSDLNGMAVLDACQKISDKIAPYKKLYPNSSWKQWIHAAYMDRVSLSATGYYRTPDINHDFKTNTGMLYNYYTFGASCSEVEIDCLTGDHQVIQTDIVMDIGESINPAIDVGQIEGGFLQGLGLFTLEELQYSTDGTLLTKGPGTYKIPANTNAPRKFNVYILEGVTNPRAVYSSKAVGEPPLFLSASVFFALKEAIISARSDANINKFQHFRMDSPATAAVIRMLCCDSITAKFPVPKPGSFKPWNIKP
ncbi:hypothetical protein J437_LFUL001901 [Ladona fulva]|uniref:Aldehyde oxidase/xanthine dehydrogenase a/b hammerhead domain-containing protein n=1 Tax=Ladona fulva TaxID=123851 RepID=A0A8K0JZ34_LADFU|nr:hypothetical protein J437_LFUL001901 [Ladona fulva]